MWRSAQKRMAGAAKPQFAASPRSPNMRSPRPTLSNFGSLLPRPNQAQQASVTSPQEPSSASGSRPPQKLSGRSSSSSTSAGNGSVASSPTVSSSSSEWLGFAGLFQPRPYPRPQSGNSSLKKALGQRGGVVKERDGFEVFFGVEKSKEKKKLRKSLDSRDGFDKFYGIPSAGAEEDSSTSPTRRCEDGQRHMQMQLQARLGGASAETMPADSPECFTSGVPAESVPGVPAGVPTYSLAEPALPKGVETFSISQR